MVKGFQPDLYVHWDLYSIVFLRDDSVTKRVREADGVPKERRYVQNG